MLHFADATCDLQLGSLKATHLVIDPFHDPSIVASYMDGAAYASVCPTKTTLPQKWSSLFGLWSGVLGGLKHVCRQWLSTNHRVLF